MYSSRQPRPAWPFDTCERPWVERWLDWERLRTAGRLSLFGASYSAPILIPIVFHGLALYNDKIALVRAWATQITLDYPMHQVAVLPRPLFPPADLNAHTGGRINALHPVLSLARQRIQP